MLITKVTGGLGNQMFIYATAKAISKKNNIKFKLDISSYTYKNLRKPLLEFFNIKCEYANDHEVRYFKKFNKKYSIKSIINKLSPQYKKEYIQERCLYQFDEKITQINPSKNVYLNGYWQNEKYFRNIKNSIVKNFRLKDAYKIKNKNLLNGMKNSNSVSLHIRRTDYLVIDVNYVLSKEYYKDALDIINKKINNLHLYIFSDDIDWAEKNIKFKYPTTFINKKIDLEDYQELIAMSHCKHNVIANSTFSWWAAWLNQNKNKIVVCPKKYFANTEYNIDDFYPKSWLEI